MQITLILELHGGFTLPAADTNAGRRGCTIEFAIDDATACALRDGPTELEEEVVVVVADVDEELAVGDVDGVIPTISTSRDSSAFAGTFEVAVAGTELNRLEDDRDAVAGTDGVTMVVVDWVGVEEVETDTAA